MQICIGFSEAVLQNFTDATESVIHVQLRNQVSNSGGYAKRAKKRKDQTSFRRCNLETKFNDSETTSMESSAASSQDVGHYETRHHNSDENSDNEGSQLMRPAGVAFQTE